MAEKYFVSRQRLWPDGEPVVEIAVGGIDYSSPDALSPQYQALGEFREYLDPRLAAQAAIAVCEAWRKDGEKKAQVAIGIACDLVPPEPHEFKWVLVWADQYYEKMPKCARCTSLIETEWKLFGDPLGEVYCCEQCADLAWSDTPVFPCDKCGQPVFEDEAIFENGHILCEGCGPEN